ncbi:hypothetical protein RRG08_030224 [Elysia crispata]|uniref:Endonuclease/exonuclease/phosphatase domain-containing protein n=1 Tax=Elysia crispata TaxID=231223 RepID=A0AAE1AIZ3_9GAST|nr:hypothetical protein RRG08_030224 [Elysia crispata]
MEQAKSQCGQQDPLITMGDFNAPVGEGREENMVGSHGLGIRNTRVEKLIEWGHTNNLIVGSTWFQQPTRRKRTWKSPGDGSGNQIQYILISKRYRIQKCALSANTYHGAD